MTNVFFYYLMLPLSSCACDEKKTNNDDSILSIFRSLYLQLFHFLYLLCFLAYPCLACIIYVLCMYVDISILIKRNLQLRLHLLALVLRPRQQAGCVSCGVRTAKTLPLGKSLPPQVDVKLQPQQPREDEQEKHVPEQTRILARPPSL